VVEGLAAGGVDYIAKPIVVDELLARIRVHLARVAYGAGVALDASGRFLLATDRNGRLLWCTPKAKQWLAELVPQQNSQDASLPAPLLDSTSQPGMGYLRKALRPVSPSRIEDH
jgi:DNA-binding response OmpR family regulator